MLNQRRKVLKTLPLCMLLLLSFSPSRAQDNVKISGLAYLDYRYVLTSPDSDEEGENGFGYRRLYLTSDFTLSETFSVRARLEAADNKRTPFLKDLYVHWKNIIGKGHNLMMGITSPPTYTVSEDFWGYRSLEKTIQDLNKIVSSRDLGIKLNGNIASDGSLKYGVMVGNDTGGDAEEDKNKRVYGQIEWYPSDALTLTAGADYATYFDDRKNHVNINSFAGFKGEGFRVGAEGFYKITDIEGVENGIDLYGITLFGAVQLQEAWEAIVRVDQVERDNLGVTSSNTFFLTGVAFSPHEDIQIIPNVLVDKESANDDPLITGRLTVNVNF